MTSHVTISVLENKLVCTVCTCPFPSSRSHPDSKICTRSKGWLLWLERPSQPAAAILLYSCLPVMYKNKKKLKIKAKTTFQCNLFYEVSKGIRQWPKKMMYIPNDYTWKYPFWRLKLVVEIVWHPTFWTNQLNLIKVPKINKSMNKKYYYKTLGTSVSKIQCPLFSCFLPMLNLYKP